ncbi:MFS transporter [Streptomyces sp. NBC_01549]|uniref:MFS transporter n=1 Tax=Streptomyces sp. NBC_01549 TaxID=2975874 RepID=UPI002255CA87|nr:MFS transporter [Streptomyces sp. NBC_01549]MCX4589260.1 MFS transporter [Streptomyces sp. NBC_01549]
MKKRYSLRLYLAGAVAARAGDEMSGPALMLTGFALAGSTTDASSLLAGITISAAVGGPVLGALLDRTGRPGRLLAVALVLYAAGLGMILLGLGRMPFAVTILIAVVTGLLGPALSGGWTAQLPRVVLGDHLPRANTLDAMTFSVASLAGPALAGGVAEALGAPTAVVVSAGLIALALPAAWMLPARPGRARGARTTSVISDLAAGIRVIVGRPSLARATLTSVVSCIAQGMLTACIPLLGERVLGGAGRGAALLSCAAISALAANAVLTRFPRSVAPDTIIWASALVQAAALALATWRQPVVLIVAVLIAGIGEGPQLAALFAIRHREAPEHLRAQIFTTGASLKITGFALGAVVVGPVVTRSLPGALALAASAAVLATLAFFAIPSAAVNSSEDRAMSS